MINIDQVNATISYNLLVRHLHEAACEKVNARRKIFLSVLSCY